jgi:hypothetical protein
VNDYIIIIIIIINGSAAFWGGGIGRFFNLLILYTREISPSQGLYLHTGQQKQNKRTQISINRVKFEPTTTAFARGKTVRALQRAANAIGVS